MKTVLISTVLLCAAVGCASSQTQADDATEAARLAAAKRAAELARKRGDTSIVVDEEIARKCALPTAHFDFDSVNIKPGDSPALDALASCFVSGPMQGRGMKLVGHADPRGEVEYNFALGQRRAGNVARYLTGSGMGTSRIQTSSMGEAEATGTDPESWAHDRKVEILAVRDDD
jgi:peptidoglycan-associated lipoprotein